MSAAYQVQIVQRQSEQFKGVVILGNFGNGVQLKRLDDHGVLFRGMLVWLLGTLGGVHGSNCEGFRVARKSLLTGVCFRRNSRQNREASLFANRIPVGAPDGRI